MYTVRHLVAALSFIKDLNKNPNLNKLNLRPPHNYLPWGMTSLAHSPLYRELPPLVRSSQEKRRRDGKERRKRARRERTEKSKRLKALKGLYNIHYQRVSLCEISLGSAFTWWTRPSPRPPPPWFFSSQSSPSPFRAAIFFLLIRALALPQRPLSLGVQSSHVTEPSSGMRGDGTESGGERRREEGSPLWWRCRTRRGPRRDYSG